MARAAIQFNDISNLILFGLYKNGLDGPFKNFDELLTSNGFYQDEISLEDKKGLENDFLEKEIINSLREPKYASGRITQKGIEFVEKEILSKIEGIELTELNIREHIKGLLDTVGYDIVEIYPTHFQINIASDKKWFWKIEKSGNTYKINSFPEITSVGIGPYINYQIWDNLKAWASRASVELGKTDSSSNSLFRHALSTKPEDENLIQQNFQRVGIIGYIYTSLEKDRVEFIEYQHNLEPSKHFYSSLPSEERLEENNLTELGILGYLLKRPKANHKQIYRYFRNFLGVIGDHLYLTNPNDQVLIRQGYKREKPHAYLSLQELEGTVPLYIYSQNPAWSKELMLDYRDFIENNSDFKKPSANTKNSEESKFQADSSITTSEEDKLNREPFVDALYAYIANLWKSSKTHESFTINIDGAWGEGKTSVMSLLKTKLESNEWIVAEYNAWQNQHVKSPWWVLFNNIKSRIEKTGCRSWIQSKCISLYYRIFRPYYLILFLLLITSIAFWLIPKDVIVLFITKKEYDSNNIPSNYLNLVIGIKYLFSTATIFAAFLPSIRHLLIGSYFDYSMNRGIELDPYFEIKEFYSRIVGSSNKNVAVFIDDLDRCNSESCVRLMEGIQTICKDAKVLFVFACDLSWVSQAFTIEYDSFKDLGRPGNSIGSQFIAKSFQLSISIPPLSPDLKHEYLKHLLGVDNKPVDEEVVEKLINEFTSIRNESDINKNLKKIKKQKPEYQTRLAIIKELSKKLNENSTQIKKDVKSHILEGQTYLKFFDPNPRTIKRLINQYTLLRQYLILGGSSDAISMDSLIRWMIVKTKYPDKIRCLKEKSYQLKNDSLDNEIKEILGEDIHSNKDLLRLLP